MLASRALRFPVPQLKELLRTRPFQMDAWRDASAQLIHLRIGNGPIARDRSSSLAMLSSFLNRTEDVGCGYYETWQQREAIIAETSIEFIDQSGKLTEIPCAIFVRTTHGLIQDMRLYLDPARIP